MSSRNQWSVLLAMAAVTACTERGKDPPWTMIHSFDVALTKDRGQETGEESAPLPYISGTSCATNQCPGDEECIGYCSPSGEACSADADCPTGTYCAKVCAKPAYLDILAVGRDGKPTSEEAETWVHVRMVPGFVPPPFEYVKLSQGKASDVKVYIAQAVGESYVWVEDVGMGPSQEAYGECNDGKDGDGDGFIDMADPDCTEPLDPEEDEATYATGLSPAFFYEFPTIWHIQYTDQVSTSPLDGHDVYVDKGHMIVTNIVANGFYITDLDGQKAVRDDGSPGYYNSFFLYTFSKPEEVLYEDVLCTFSGGVVEYQGNTQMTYPTYDVYRGKDWDAWGKESPCELRTDLPEGLELELPPVIDVTDMLQKEDPKSSDYTNQLMATAQALEPYESSLVSISDVELSVRFLACDSDEDDSYPSGSDDDLCRDTCQADPYCTQLESYFQYSQVGAYVADRKKIFIATDTMKGQQPLEVAFIGANDESGNCPDIEDPETGEVLVENPHKVTIGDTLYVEYTCPQRSLDKITGNLRHIYMCDPKPGKKESCGLQLTMIIPRMYDDFVFSK